MNTIAVRLKDLIKELYFLCNLNISYDVIGYHVFTNAYLYGYYEFDKMIKIVDNSDNMYLGVILFGKKNNKYVFFYNFKFKLNLYELEYDDSKLLDNCYIKYGNSDLKHLNYSSICVSNYDNLILYFDDIILSKNNYSDFYPANLLKQAIKNCYKDKAKVKKKSVFD